MTAQKAIRALALALGLALAAAACTDGDLDTAEPGTTATIAPPDTVLRIGVEAWPRCVNPLTCADEALYDTVLQHVLPRAMTIAPDGDYVASRLLAGEPQPVTLDDGTIEIRYRIADDAVWADGRPVTSTDFVATWQAVMDTPGADTTGYRRIVSVDDADPAEAVVVLDTPLVDWQELFGGASGFVLQADAFGAGPDLSGRFDEELPISGGPYQLVSWDSERAVLAATDAWEGEDQPDVDQVRLERVDIDELEEPQAYDMLVPAPGTRAEAPDGFETVDGPSGRILGVWLDQRSSLLSTLEGRRAIDALLARDDLVEAAGFTAVSCAGWAPAIGPWCDAAATERSAADPDLARFVLATQGWVPDGAGNLVNGETVLSLPMTHDPATPGSTALADEVAAAFDEVGIGVERRETPTDTWWEARPLDQGTGVGLFAVDVGASPRVGDLYGCPDGAPTSVVAACPPAIVEAARSLGTMDPTDALDSVAMIGELVAEQVLWVPVVELPGRGFVRVGRVDLPEQRSPVGGPLAGLAAFQGGD